MYEVVLYKDGSIIKLSKHRKKELAIKSLKKFQNHPKLEEGWKLDLYIYLSSNSKRGNKSNRKLRNKKNQAAPDLQKMFDGIFRG